MQSPIDRRIEKSTQAAMANPAMSVAKMAEVASFSISRFRELFREFAAQSPREYRANARIQKAKELLRQTSLDASTIAEESGFGSYVRFAVAFKKTVGVTPMAFRKSSRDPLVTSRVQDKARGKESLWFQDDFNSSFLEPWWTRLMGNWHPHDGMLTGKSHSQTLLVLTRQLPENFRAEFEIQFIRQGGLLPGDLIVELRNQDGVDPFCVFTIGERSNSFGTLRRKGVEKQWNVAARVKETGWQKVVMELFDNRISFSMHGETLFSYVDAFPVPYPNRCTMAIGGWQSLFDVRHFRIFDLGFLPLSPTVRRGDALYNAGLYDQAGDHCMRVLETGPMPLDAAELRYKIGMCFLQTGKFAQAREWLSKVTAVAGNNLWINHARVALLQLTGEQEDWQDFEKQARELFRDADLRSDVREAIRLAVRGITNTGFREKGLPLQQLLCELEEKNSVMALLAQMQLAGSYLDLREYEQAEPIYRNIAEDPGTPHTLQVVAHFHLGDLYSYQGMFDRSDKEYGAIGKMAVADYDLAWAEVNQGHNLRGRGQFSAAVKQYLGVKGPYSDVDVWSRFGELEATLVLGMLGQLEEMDAIMADFGGGFPAIGHRFAHAYFRGDFAGAAKEFQREVDTRGLSGAAALNSIKCAIMHCLTGDNAKADSILKDTSRRYPSKTWFYFGDLAKWLLENKPVDLDSMPGIPRTRSEMMFVLGLWYEKNSDASEAKRMFEAAAGEDPTNRWPAWLARKKVSSIQ